MQKKASEKKSKVNRKLRDLAPKKVKGGDAASIKGGPIYMLKQ